MRPRRALVASLAVAALAACSSGPGAQGELTWEDSPLDKALGALYGMDEDPEEWQREEDERSRKVEEMIATCMAEEGFEYVPMDTSSASFSFVDDEDWDSEEWAAQYGYGVSTDPWADDQPVEPAEEWVDPNEDYVMAMSESEQTAYYEALYGASTFEEEEWVEDDVIIEDDYSWEEAGCQGLAHHEVYESGENDVWEDPAYTEFFEAMEGLYADVQRDPRIAEINDEWAQCMADAGISGMTSPDEASTVFYTEWDALYTEASDQIDWEAIDWEALDAAGTMDPVAEAMDQTALADLREREIAAAVADRGCQEDLDTQSQSLAVQFEFEEKFVETYQAEIDAISAALGPDA